MNKLQRACKQVDIEQHGRAQFNPSPDHCWGKMRRCTGYCYHKRRKGKFTCASHNPAEFDARRLQRIREDEIRKWEIDL